MSIKPSATNGEEPENGENGEVEPETEGGVEAVTGAADLRTDGVAPGQITSIFGRELGPAKLASLTVGANRRVTGYLGDTKVLVNQPRFVARFCPRDGRRWHAVLEHCGGRATGQSVVVCETGSGDYACNRWDCSKAPSYGASCYQHGDGIQESCSSAMYHCTVPLCPLMAPVFVQSNL